MQIIGLGAQDNLTLAKDFVAKTGVASFPMVWDKSLKSWVHYEIQLNSETWILDKTGKRIRKKFGFDEKEILASVRALA